MDQQQNFVADTFDPNTTELPKPIDALKFVRGAMESWAASGGVQPLSVPAVATLLVLQLVRDPATVKVYITTAFRSITVEFEVEEADKGRIIGKGGHTIDALRSLARSVAGASEREYQISLIGDRYRVRDQPAPYCPHQDE